MLKKIVLAAIPAFIYMTAGSYLGYQFGYAVGYKQAIVDEKSAVLKGVHNIWTKFRSNHE